MKEKRGNMKRVTILFSFMFISQITEAEMKFKNDIIQLTLDNKFFRKELVTGKNSQVVLMSIPMGSDIGIEVHKVDQVLIFIEGTGQAIIGGQTFDISPNQLFFVPAGTQHNFINTGSQPLKLFTIYAPPQHKPGTVEETKGSSYD